MGGYLAFALWRLAPERMRALALCSTRATADDRCRARGPPRDGRSELSGSSSVESIVEPMVERLLGPGARMEAHVVGSGPRTDPALLTGGDRVRAARDGGSPRQHGRCSRRSTCPPWSSRARRTRSSQALRFAPCLARSPGRGWSSSTAGISAISRSRARSTRRSASFSCRWRRRHEQPPHGPARHPRVPPVPRSTRGGDRVAAVRHLQVCATASSTASR